ncbi:unnamed protein product [Rhizophagus irregularis]|nr:unnamed protein product [Rhizophagus irregularis]
MNYLTPLYDKFIESHINIVPKREGYYLTRISTGGYLICYDYIWNDPFRDVCKHNHVAKIYQQSQTNNLLFQQVKADLVNYFKNKHRVLSAEKKNELIYNGDVEIAFDEIIKIFEIQGGAIFQANRIQSDINNDPFRPIMPNNHETTSFGAPPKPKAKPRKPLRILQAAQQNSQETSLFASEK